MKFVLAVVSLMFLGLVAGRFALLTLLCKVQIVNC